MNSEEMKQFSENIANAADVVTNEANGPSQSDDMSI